MPTGHVLILRQSEPYPYGWVRNQAKALADAGYEVTVICPTGHGYDALEETVDGVLALRYPSPASGGGLVGYVREYALSSWRILRLIRRARQHRPVDVVIASTPPDFLVWLALPLRRRGAGVVFDQRDPGPELFEAKFGRRGVLHRVLVALERSAFRRADIAMPHNESCADLARHRGGVAEERIFIVGVGPDPERIFPVPERPELRRGKRFLVLWIGAISAQESVGRLVEAIELLVKERGRSDVAFSIVGPGDGRGAVQADVANRGLDAVVEVPGVVTDPDLLRAYMATADVCVSVDEENPMNEASTMMKVLEYMAMGRAVVQTPLHEMSRISGDATVYAHSGDPVHLADKIEHLLADPEMRQELGRRARKRMEQGLMWPDQAPIMVDAVEAARRPARR